MSGQISLDRPPGGEHEISWSIGTLRTRSPEDTWETIQPLLREIGCTRVADLSHLDPAGVPVHTAIRPAARSLATSQGKGVTAALSRVSAAMESLETWHAEEARPPAENASRSELDTAVRYPLGALELTQPSLLHDDFPLDWLPAVEMVSKRQSFVPDLCVRLDRGLRPEVWQPPLLQLSSTGLASGNDAEEAMLHALCEIVEREAINRSARQITDRPIDAGAIGDPTLREIVGTLSRPGQRSVRLYHLPSDMKVPCFAAVVWDRTLPLPFGGFGCHPSTAIAASRAITEAVQNRVALIAGSRDDLEHRIYRKIALQALSTAKEPAESERPLVEAPESLPFVGLSHAVAQLAERITQVAGYEPLGVALSAPGDPVAVVKVVAPGLKDHDMHGLRMGK